MTHRPPEGHDGGARQPDQPGHARQNQPINPQQARPQPYEQTPPTQRIPTAPTRPAGAAPGTAATERTPAETAASPTAASQTGPLPTGPTLTPSGRLRAAEPQGRRAKMFHDMKHIYRTRMRTVTVVLVVLWLALLGFYGFSSEHYPPLEKRPAQVSRTTPPPEPTETTPTPTSTSTPPSTSETPETSTTEPTDTTEPDQTGRTQGPSGTRTTERQGPWPQISIPVPGQDREDGTSTPPSGNNR